MKKDFLINFEHFTAANELTELEISLLETAKKARENAYAPYSDFLVGCAVLLENGEIFSGNNQENAAYPSGLCAERTAVYWVAANFPDEKISKIFVVGGPRNSENPTPPIPPCGNCRQSLMEYESKQNQNIQIYFASLSDEVFKVSSVKDLLPFYFDSSFL
ncbi:cytidine deaminase [Chryseobacterium sp. Leaf404]|uniref:cytidine deaminase n=1 Tax=unclassified Chryseobacterium TaxID=2593645 RepID=UPI0006F6B2AC|nr:MULTISPECIES: cytidine deaminase [unclassified Chryseobacterium]KQT20513.1 cytidine deaminase [Chryseobacterium sp. Leaf404]